MSNEIYFKSSNVTVYPCAYRGANDEVIQFNQKSRLITEEGLTTTGSSGDLARSYIVSYADNCLKAVIKGYYFEIKNIKDQFNYLNIKLKQIESGDEYQTVLSSIIDESENVLDVKQGDDYIFTGIVGSSEAITGCDYLKVFDDNYEIVKTSYLPSYDDELGALHTANNEANATNATAFGNNNKASTSDGQFAVGRFNNDDGSLFSVGNGTSDSKRSNVFSTGSAKGTKINENTAINGTLTISGNTTISGKLDVKKSLELTDTLTVGKETTLQDKLIVEKNGAEISGDSKITGNLTSTGALSGLTLDIASTADISGDVAAKSNVTINGSVNINKTNDDFTNKINEDGITTAAIKADSIQLTKNVENTIAGKVVINNDLEVTGTENVDKVMATDLNATNSLNVTFNKEYITTINKNGISTKTVAATGDITSDGVLTVKGATNSAFSGSITAKSGKTDYNNNKNNHVALLSDLLDLLYPVGAIYVMDAYTFNSTEMIQSDSDLICPLEKKLGGTWKLIKNKFLHCENKFDSAEEGGSDKAYYVPMKQSDTSTISIGQPYIRNLQWSDNSSNYDGGYSGWKTGSVGRKADYWNDWNNIWNNSSFEKAWQGKAEYSTTNYLWCESYAKYGNLTDAKYWHSDKLTATWYTGKGNDNRWTNAVITSYDDNLNYKIYPTGMSVDQHVLIAASDHYENRNDVAQEKITSPLLPTDNKIIYEKRDTYKQAAADGYWGFYGGTNNSFSEDDISGVWSNYPNSFQINMNHRHSAKVNIQIEPDINNCTKISDTNKAIANMPAYQKVYAWIRTE